METTNQPELPENQVPHTETLQLDLQAIEHLKETRKWTNFLSISTFVILGLLILFVIIMTGMMSVARPGFMGFLPLIPMSVLVVLYFFPIYYLYQFSKFAKQATVFYDSQALSEALRYLQRHYRYLGIVLIVVMAFYLLIGIGALARGQLMHLFGRM